MPAARGPYRVDLQNPISSHPLNRGLVSWWLPLPHLIGGRRLWDLRNRAHGVLTGFPATGAEWISQPNRFGGLLLDGSNDYVLATMSAIPRPFTVIGAYNATTTYTAGGVVLFSHDDGTNSGYRVQLGYSGGNTTLTLTFGAVADYPFAGLTTTTGLWSFAAVTVPVDSGTATAWLASNTELKTTTAAVGSATGTPTRATISSNLFSDVVHFPGKVGFVVIVSGTMTSQAVQAWHTEWRTGFPNLLRRYPERSWFILRESAAAAGGATIPVFAHHYRMQGMQ